METFRGKAQVLPLQGKNTQDLASNSTPSTKVASKTAQALAIEIADATRACSTAIQALHAINAVPDITPSVQDHTPFNSNRKAQPNNLNTSEVKDTDAVYALSDSHYVSNDSHYALSDSQTQSSLQTTSLTKTASTKSLEQAKILSNGQLLTEIKAEGKVSKTRAPAKAQSKTLTKSKTVTKSKSEGETKAQEQVQDSGNAKKPVKVKNPAQAKGKVERQVTQGITASKVKAKTQSFQTNANHPHSLQLNPTYQAAVFQVSKPLGLTGNLVSFQVAEDSGIRQQFGILTQSQWDICKAESNLDFDLESGFLLNTPKTQTESSGLSKKSL